jgi:hypothetical protein
VRPNAAIEEVVLPPCPQHARAGVLSALAETIRTGIEPQFFPSGRANLGTLATIAAALRKLDYVLKKNSG